MGNQLNQQQDNRKTEITADALLSVIQGLIDESPNGDRLKHGLNLDYRLEHDLGLDSLAPIFHALKRQNPDTSI
ncbi:MAG: hypothetical protein ABW161_09905 [Candidatus Thiodiazotropha sp.]